MLYDLVQWVAIWEEGHHRQYRCRFGGQMPPRPQALGLSHHSCKSRNDNPEWDCRQKTQSANAGDDGEDRDSTFQVSMRFISFRQLSMDIGSNMTSVLLANKTAGNRRNQLMQGMMGRIVT